MSLIPWVLHGANRTVVTDKRDFDPEGNAIYVEHYNPEELDDEKNTNATYDLHVGKNYVKLGDSVISPLHENETIRLRPGEAAIIDTMEQVEIPKKLFGLIVARQSKLADGLENTTTKVDPGFGSSVLHITVINHQRVKMMELKYNEPFCALCLFQTSGDVRSLGKGADSIQIRPRGHWWAGPLKWLGLRDSKVIWVILSALAGWAALAWNIYNNVVRSKPPP